MIKKILYNITVSILILFGFPFMFFCTEKWNEFGRKVDKFFGIKSQHTINYENGKYQ